MNNPTAEAIETVLPEAIREYVRVTCDIKPHDGFDQLCRAIGEAFQRFQSVPARWREIELMLSDDPPMVIGQSCAMTFVPRQGVAAFTIGDVILLRTSQLFVADYDFQVYAVLEELTHALLNLADESLAAWIVTFLYSDRVAYRDGFYVPAASFQPHWPPKRKDWASPPRRHFDYRSN